VNGFIFKFTGNVDALLARLRQALASAPAGVIVQMFLPRRTNEQNAKMWAMLSDLSRAKPQGRSLRPEHWKCLFMDDLGHKPDWQPSLGGESVVNVGYKSSRLTKAQMSDMIERMYAYGAEHGVEWSEPKGEAA
jgi:hypothetical protein